MSLSLRAVTFRYPGAEAPVIEDVSLDVAAGESVALMAPSGAGKSTLLQLAGLLLRPQAGSIRIGDHDVTASDAAALLGTEVVWILQTVSLLPRRTVLDNVMLPALAQGGARDEARPRAGDLLDALGVEVDPLMPARQLSGGQAQRVGVARALMCSPTLLLADEPTANLDLATAREVAGAIVEATSGRAALLLATHDPVVAGMADRQVQLDSLGSGARHVVTT